MSNTIANNYIQLSQDEAEPEPIAEPMSASSSTTQSDSVPTSSKGEMEESVGGEDKEGNFQAWDFSSLL